MRMTVLFGYGLVLATVAITGCSGGGGGGTAAPAQIQQKGQSGTVTQGPVAGAQVWADSLEGGVRMVIDANEQGTVTTSRADGTFQLPLQPAYRHVIVSRGGTDTITNQPATTMMAPAGATACSPLTTVVALDTTGTLAAKINALLPPGKTFADDLSTVNALSPAALLLINSIESTVTSLNRVIVAASGSSTAISSAQQSTNQLETYSSISQQLAGMTSSQMQSPAALATNLTTAIGNAITSIDASSSNVTVSSANLAGIAAAVATNAVASSAQMVGTATGDASLQSVSATTVTTSTAQASTSGTLTEASALTADSITKITSSISEVATTQSAAVTATTTPAGYTPPQDIPVVSNPGITAYRLSASPTSSNWVISSFTINFSETMNAAASGTPSYASSVLNPANVFGGGCTPASYSGTTLTISCPAALPSGATLTVTLKGTIANSTLNGVLLVDNIKSFSMPSNTGSSGFTMF